MGLSTFERLGLPSDLVRALAARHITEPFAIQASSLPDALAGRDILGRAPTGSGKTLAFGLPALVRLASGERAPKRRPRGLILSPTRELAEQIQRELDPPAGAIGRRVAAVYGGAALGPQVKALSRGVDLLVATPGRLLDLIDQGEVALDLVEITVVDEADRMADMGFLPDVKRLLDQTADDRQTLLFSATLDGDVRALTDRYQRDPALHEVGDPEPDLSLVDHRFIKVKKPHRLGVAVDLIAEAGGPTIVFVRTRHGVDRLARQLKQNGIKAGYIHGGRTQSQRNRALGVFTEGKVDALVATDVAARGIHVDGVACVLHYDPPAETKDYVHRSGRTARAGAGGTVISLLDPVQVRSSQKMQRELGIEAEVEAPPRRRPRPTPDPGAGEGRSTRVDGDEGPEGARPARSVRTAKSDRLAKRDRAAKQEGSTQSDRGAKRERSARPDRSARPERASEGAESPRPPRGDKPAGPGRPGKRAKPGRAGKGPRSAKGPKRGKTTKRSGRPRPPNRKGRKGSARGSGSSSGSS